jgi:hypothetical protein
LSFSEKLQIGGTIQSSFSPFRLGKEQCNKSGAVGCGQVLQFGGKRLDRASAPEFVRTVANRSTN